MAHFQCTSCGYEEDDEIHEPPAKCPFCKATTEDTPDLWEEME